MAGMSTINPNDRRSMTDAYDARLKSTMLARNISWRELIEAVGSADGDFAPYRPGGPSLWVCTLIADALGVNPAWLAFGVGDPDAATPAKGAA